MNASTLEEKVLEIVQDASFEDNVLPFLNQGLFFIAKEQNLSSLEASDTLTALSTTNNVPLPDNYMKNIYSVNKNGALIGDPNYYYEFPRFLRYHPDLSNIGTIVDVAVKGRSLYYCNREDTDLDIRFFEFPEKLESGKSIPSCLPDYLHEPLLANYAAWKIYDLIEDGIEDQKTNTRIYQNLFFSYLADLKMYSIETDIPVYIQDEADRM